MNTLYAVRRSAVAAVATLEPAEWESAITTVFNQLQSQSTISSWSAGSYHDGLIVHFTVPGQPAGHLIILPRFGRGPAGV